MEIPNNAEATIRLYRARVKALEQSGALVTSELQELGKQLQEAQNDVRALRTEKLAWNKARQQLEAQAEKARAGQVEAADALEAAKQEIKELRKNEQRTAKERAGVQAEAHADSMRLRRALEELERHKQLLAEARQKDSGRAELLSSEVSAVQAEVRRLERQKGELLAVVKKQMRLIDVLQRQKVHLEATKALALTEAEFMKILDWNT